MILPVASVVTKKTICEFDLLKLSIEQHHECQWVISCDGPAYEKYCEVDNIKCLKLIETDDCDHNVASEKQKDNWMKVMMTKFDAVEELLKEHNHALFLDCDMIFVNPIEDRIISLFKNNDIDASICQHMTNDWPTEAQHGLYNGGMFHVRSKQFIKQWKMLSSQYKKYGFYFEQQPLEYVQRNFNSFNLPINYNIGWWRFNRQSTQKRIDLLNVRDNKIYFGSKPAVNFHVHTLREIGYQNFGQFLVDKIVLLMKEANNKNYEELLRVLEPAQ
tara:strand:- start:3958 stop:4779 length:822 start_codon:yes stop_codon:yes gene_type:complete